MRCYLRKRKRIVRNDEHAGAVSAQTSHHVEKVVTAVSIKCAGRLVKNIHATMQHDCCRDAHPTAQAARKLKRVRREELGTNTHRMQGIFRTRARILGRASLLQRAKHHFVKHGCAKQHVFALLKHKPHVTGLHGRAVQRECASEKRRDARQTKRARRFPATRFTCENA